MSDLILTLRHVEATAVCIAALYPLWRCVVGYLFYRMDDRCQGR